MSPLEIEETAVFGMGVVMMMSPGWTAAHVTTVKLEALPCTTIATPATFHAEQALAVLAAGKPVYIEKPIAVNVADAEEVRALAAAVLAFMEGAFQLASAAPGAMPPAVTKPPTETGNEPP